MIFERRPVLIGVKDGARTRHFFRGRRKRVLDPDSGPGGWGLFRAQEQKARNEIALGEANETRACLQIAQRAKYVRAVSPSLLARLERVIGTLWKVTH